MLQYSIQNPPLLSFSMVCLGLPHPTLHSLPCTWTLRFRVGSARLLLDCGGSRKVAGQCCVYTHERSNSSLS